MPNNVICTVTNASGEPATVHHVPGQFLAYVAKWAICGGIWHGASAYADLAEAIACAKASYGDVRPSLSTATGA